MAWKRKRVAKQNAIERDHSTERLNKCWRCSMLMGEPGREKARKQKNLGRLWIRVRATQVEVVDDETWVTIKMKVKIWTTEVIWLLAKVTVSTLDQMCGRKEESKAKGREKKVRGVWIWWKQKQMFDIIWYDNENQKWRREKEIEKEMRKKKKTGRASRGEAGRDRCERRKKRSGRCWKRQAKMNVFGLEFNDRILTGALNKRHN